MMIIFIWKKAKQINNKKYLSYELEMIDVVQVTKVLAQQYVQQWLLWIPQLCMF